MKRYDFDTIIERANTNSIKFDFLKEEEMLPLWIADMDFPVCDAIVEAGKKRLDHPIFGYSSIPCSLYEALCEWQRTRHGACFPTDQIIPYYSVVSAMNLILMSLTKKKDVVTIMSPVYMRFPTSVYETSRSLRISPLARQIWQVRNQFRKLGNLSQNQQSVACCAIRTIRSAASSPKRSCERIYELCVKYDILVVSDEIHADILMPPFQHIPFTSIDPEAGEANNHVGFIDEDV
ncbi:MAG: aminotransferase class I/II-fold pyridoxal phosphate-dependent enzyme [Bacillus subtilis]|nr:aminotransferase class I/II-fold pyridoxal phosphate-dependent enzyme [Bacillus subtilis]